MNVNILQKINKSNKMLLLRYNRDALFISLEEIDRVIGCENSMLKVYLKDGTYRLGYMLKS